LVGLPTRVELLVVDPSCNPIPNATVEVWHASPEGLYSGAPVNGKVGNDLSTGFCTGNDSAALAAGWFRAYQTSGADGRVTFDTIFPGWYSGRTWHIHFTVTVNGAAYITSQLFADEFIKNDVYNYHPSYASRPTSLDGYTSNATDNVITQSAFTVSEVVMSHARQSDGALLMWKSITVHS
jgi:protocatechuate 3,4-dioxygenase beta subunit